MCIDVRLVFLWVAEGFLADEFDAESAGICSFAGVIKVASVGDGVWA